MAQRELSQRQVTSVTMPDDKTGDMWATGAKLADVGIQLKQKADLANMNNFAAQSQLEMAKVTNDWRVKNEGNPTDQKAIDELHQSYDSILNQYDEKIGFVSRGTWSQAKNKIKAGYQEQNMAWGVKQSVKNAETSINTSIKTNLQMAAEFGRTGNIEEARKHYDGAAMGLDAFATGVIGSETQAQLTADFKADYIKSFVMGKAEVDPAGALTLLEDEQVRKDIGDEKDIIQMKAFASKQQTAMLRQAKVDERIAVDDEYLKIINKQSSFDQIDSRVGPGGYSAQKAQWLKKILVQAEPLKDDKLTIARYIEAVSNLPIDNQEEAQKVFDSIMADPDIKDATKSILLYDTDIGTKDNSGALADFASGRAKKSGKWMWGWFQSKANTNDAVDAFLRFKNGLKGDESVTALKKRAQRAISDVAMENNDSLSDLGTEWVDMVDGNGTAFKARKNDDGEIETEMIYQGIDSTDNSGDNSNGD